MTKKPTVKGGNFGRLTQINRLTNSVYGNPQFDVVINGMIYRTEANSSLAYGISNYLQEVVDFEYKIKYNRFYVTKIELKK